MGKTITLVIIAVLVILGIYYFMGTGTSTLTGTYASSTSATGTGASGTNTEAGEYGSTTGSTSPQNATSSATKTANVEITNFAFTPSTLTVKAGTKVTWTNKDTVSHTVTSTTGSELNSSRLASGQTYSHTFTKAGTYSYYCTIHPNMKATIVVTQ